MTFRDLNPRSPGARRWLGSTLAVAVAAVRDIDELTDDHGHMVLFETQFRPNELDGDDKGISAPHGGLGIFAMCDGSVQTITQSIDAELYNSLATRAGRELIDVEDAF